MRTNERTLLVAGVAGIIAVVATLSIIGVRSQRAHVAGQAVVHRSAQPSSPPACTLSQLHIAVGPGLAGNSDTGGVITFTNGGTTPCAMGGYPEVTAFAPGGAVVRAQASATGALEEGRPAGQPGSVTLTPGAVASAVLESPDRAPNGGACPKAAILRVAPPHAPHFVLLWATFDLAGTHTQVFVPTCQGLAVHQLLAGAVGTV